MNKTDELMCALLEALAKHEGNRDAKGFLEKRKASKMAAMAPGEKSDDVGDADMIAILAGPEKEDEEEYS